MKRNLLSSMVALALGVHYAADSDGGGSEKKSLVSIPKTVASWHDQGKKEGKRAHDLIERGEMLTSEILLVYGEHLGEHDSEGNLLPSATDFLNGYASAWSNPNSAKVRKSEAKAVFDAFALGDQVREVVIGYEKVPEGSKESPKPIKESNTIAEWLKMHDSIKGKDGYRGLIDFAKELRGPASGKGAGGGSNRGPRAVTTKQQGEILERVDVMTPNQAHSVAQRAVAQLSKMPKFEVVMFRSVMNAMEMITNKSTDEACRKRAQAIWDLAEDQVQKLKEDLNPTKEQPKISSAAPAASTEELPAAPAPATEKKAA